MTRRRKQDEADDLMKQLDNLASKVDLNEIEHGGWKAEVFEYANGSRGYLLHGPNGWIFGAVDPQNPRNRRPMIVPAGKNIDKRTRAAILASMAKAQQETGTGKRIDP